MEVKHIWVHLDPETKKIVAVKAMDNARKDAFDAATYAVRYLCDFEPFAEASREIMSENELTKKVKEILNSAYGVKGSPESVDRYRELKKKTFNDIREEYGFPRRVSFGDPFIKLMSAPAPPIDEENFQLLLKRMSDMSKEIEKRTGGAITQGTYVIEECSELTKELTKLARGKGEESAIIEEAIDILASVSVLLTNIGGMNETSVKRRIGEKYRRALSRWAIGEI